ncbi:MAG: hypothetical protein AAGF88_08745 [Pseudomonadota bacterium]
MKSVFLAGIGVLVSAAAAWACPSPTAAGLGQFEADAQILRRGISFEVTGGGATNLAGCPTAQPAGGGASGFFLTPPHMTLSLDAVVRRTVFVGTRTQSGCDPVILVQSPGGTWFWNDDDRFRDAQVAFQVDVDGAMNIWVGSADGAPCDTRVFVRIIERDNDSNLPGAPGSPDDDDGDGGGFT